MNELYEESIISTLEQYSPKPGSRFYNRMADAPWSRKRKAFRFINYRQFAIGITSIFIVAIALSFSIPSVRAAVLKYLGLMVSSSETIPNPAIPAESLIDNQKVGEISKLAGWPVKVPTWLPEGYKFSDAMYDPSNRLVILSFFSTRPLPGNDPNMTMTEPITIVQALHNDIIPLMVAPGTSVVDLIIHKKPAAYVIGAWENDAVSGQATWNNTYPLQNIYWQIDDVYLTLNTKDVQVSKEDLIKLAESMK